ncbi:uncharacterized protein LOC117101888 [Anneissia japonica]|uniref:uncharacterized protein LOC117101888 n=1 Tax=Anneissia japonica TaxID=1529436 RepID=UPI001425783A|nr:uncharacterized protein LOC117101888 [Anneissia japonica]
MENNNCASSSSIVRTLEKDMAHLDKILHSLEQDTSRQLQLIEKENIQSSALEIRLKETEGKIKSLEEANSKLDEDTKRVHHQFRQNRDSVDGLKRHYTVLVQHQEALSQRYQSSQDDWQKQKIEIERALLHYEETWQRYKCKYECMPMAVEFRKHKQEFEEIQRKLQASFDINKELKNKLRALQYRESTNQTWTNCVVKLAKMKTETFQVEKEIKQIQEINQQMLIEVKEEKERQNRLMQEYCTKKKIQEERANQLRIAQQWKIEQRTQSKQRELHVRSTETAVTVSTTQDQNLMIPHVPSIPQIPSFPQVPSIPQVLSVPKPVVPSKPYLPSVSMPYLNQQPDKTKYQAHYIPQLEINSPSLLGTTRNFQPRTLQMTAANQPQISCPPNLIHCKPRATPVTTRLPSLRTSTATYTSSQTDKSQEKATSMSMYFQIPTLYQPSPKPSDQTVQTSQSLTPVIDTQVQTRPLPSGPGKYLQNQPRQGSLEGPQEQRPTQRVSAQCELPKTILPSAVDREVITNRQSQSPCQQQIVKNNHRNQDLQLENQSKAKTSIPEHAVEDGTSGPHAVAEHPSGTDHQVVTALSTIDNTPMNTYQVLLPDDGRSLFETHQAHFEASGNKSPGFQFGKRPMFKTNQQKDKERPSQEQSIGQPDTDGNPFFQSFFQVGVSGDTDVQQLSNKSTDTWSQKDLTKFKDVFSEPLEYKMF